MTIEGWTNLIRGAGTNMNADKAAGLLHGSLELLALHYGMIDMGRLASIASDKSYGRGIKAALEFISVFAATAQGGEKNVIGRLAREMEKRFAKFA